MYSWIKGSCSCCVVISLLVCVLESSIKCTYYFVIGTESCRTKEKAPNCKPVHKDSDHKNTPKHQNKYDKDRCKYRKHKSKHKHTNPRHKTINWTTQEVLWNSFFGQHIKVAAIYILYYSLKIKYMNISNNLFFFTYNVP